MMRKYCKAYYVRDLRKFKGWKEKTENLRKEKKVVDGQEVEVSRDLTDDDFLYIHENFVVTDGIFSDKNIIFDDVTEEWKKFCIEELKFEIPDFEAVEVSEKKEGTDKKA